MGRLCLSRFRGGALWCGLSIPVCLRGSGIGSLVLGASLDVGQGDGGHDGIPHPRPGTGPFAHVRCAIGGSHDGWTTGDRLKTWVRS